MNKIKFGLLVVGVIAASVLLSAVFDGPAERVVEKITDKPVGALTGPVVPYNYQVWGGMMEQYSVGDLANATTTTIALLNPTSATSTIEFFSYNVTGVATTTHTLSCGTSTSPYVAATAKTLVDGTVEYATSTSYELVNGVGSAEGPYSAGTSEFRIIVKPSEYIVCTVADVAAGTDYTGAFTETTNTYAGKYSIQWKRLYPLQ